MFLYKRYLKAKGPFGGVFKSLTHFCAYISELEKIFIVNVEVVQMLEKNCLKYVKMCCLPAQAENVLVIFIF